MMSSPSSLCITLHVEWFLQVFCDMETNGGGWTVIQRRKIGLTSFNRDWKQYKKGFGSIRGDFWLGNDHIFRLTRQPSMLRIELEVWHTCWVLQIHSTAGKILTMHKPFHKCQVLEYKPRTNVFLDVQCKKMNGKVKLSSLIVLYVFSNAGLGRRDTLCRVWLFHCR